MVFMVVAGRRGGASGQWRSPKEMVDLTASVKRGSSRRDACVSTRSEKVGEGWRRLEKIGQGGRRGRGQARVSEGDEGKGCRRMQGKAGAPRRHLRVDEVGEV